MRNEALGTGMVVGGPGRAACLCTGHTHAWGPVARHEERTAALISRPVSVSLKTVKLDVAVKADIAVAGGS